LQRLHLDSVTDSQTSVGKPGRDERNHAARRAAHDKSLTRSTFEALI